MRICGRFSVGAGPAKSLMLMTSSTAGSVKASDTVCNAPFAPASRKSSLAWIGLSSKEESHFHCIGTSYEVEKTLHLARILFKHHVASITCTSPMKIYLPLWHTMGAKKRGSVCHPFAS